jgi:hypothetical protein
MKRIYFIIGFLLFLLAGMTYLYFSNLNNIQVNSNLSLKLAAHNSSLVFSIQNNRSVLDILKGQELFNSLIGKEKVALINALQSTLQSKPELSQLIDNQNIYISFLPGENKQIDLLLTMQVMSDAKPETLINSLKSKNIDVAHTNNLYTIKLSDSLTIYLGIEKNVVLVSTAAAHITSALSSKGDQENTFLEFIQKNDKLSKNSLASLYINYNQIPLLLKAITPAANSAEFSILNKQNAFAHLSYNFSKERIFFSGETRINDTNSYYNLFTALRPEKIDVDKILPDNTANYSLYCTGGYPAWQKKLADLYVKGNISAAIQAKKQEINSTYHLNLDGTFLPNTGTQFLTFQLSNKEKLAAISLTNPDKLRQLLLDLSTDYSPTIKQFREPNLLYYYFGEPLKLFKKPFYAIVDNFIVVANTPGAIQQFLEKYNANRLLINNDAYTRIFDQLSNTANILFYVNNSLSQSLVIDNLYADYYPHYRDKNGLKNFDSFIYQLSSDQTSFQTNLFLNTKGGKLPAESSLQADSLQSTHK